METIATQTHEGTTTSQPTRGGKTWFVFHAACGICGGLFQTGLAPLADYVSERDGATQLRECGWRIWYAEDGTQVRCPEHLSVEDDGYVGAVPAVEKKTPEQWLATMDFAHITVLDPDGWDRAAPDGPAGWNTPLSREEFEQRLMRSTVRPASR